MIPRVQVIGSWPSGPSIVVCRHVSYGDGPLVAAIMPRGGLFAVSPRFASKRPWKDALNTYGWLTGQHMVPLAPERPTAIKTLLRHIQKGGKVVIFPEGGIATDGPLPVQPGAAALWVRSGAPLIPLRYSGAEDWRLAPGGRQWFPRITLEIGDPIPAPALIEDAVRRIEREIFTPPAMCLGDLSLQTRRLGF